MHGPMNFKPIQDSLPLKLGPIDCPQTTLRNYHYTLSNIQEERSSHVRMQFDEEFRCEFGQCAWELSKSAPVNWDPEVCICGH